MTALLRDYPLRKTKDLRSAMTEALAAYVAAMEFRLPKTTTPFRFAAVYDTWSSFQNTATSAGGKLPAAAVLPDRPVYEASSLTPRMLEETWSGGELASGTLGDGSGDGFALFTLAEMTVAFVLLVRASTGPMRQAIVSVLEDAFAEDGSVFDALAVVPETRPGYSLRPNLGEPPDAAESPIRYGRVLPLPSYYGRRARFSLASQQLLDSESGAIENRWLAQFEIQAQGQLCVVRRVRAMRPRVQVVVEGIPESR